MSQPALRRATIGDAPVIAEVQVASWHTTYRGLIPDETLDALDLDARTERWREALPAPEQVTFVAETGEDGARTVIGFAAGGPNRAEAPPFDAFSGELYAIYLLASHQRGGTGGRLVRALAAALLELGHRSMIVWVLEANPARGFYERLGGRFVGAQEIKIFGRMYPEVAYGWDDVVALSGDGGRTPISSLEAS